MNDGKVNTPAQTLKVVNWLNTIHKRQKHVGNFIWIASIVPQIGSEIEQDFKYFKSIACAN